MIMDESAIGELPDSPQHGANVARRIGLLVLMATAAFFGWAVEFHLFGLNTNVYNLFGWRHINSYPLYLWVGAASLPFFVGQALFARRHQSALPLALMTCSTFFLMLAIAAPQYTPEGSNRVAAVVENVIDSGYFYCADDLRNTRHMDAAEILKNWPQLLPTLPGHVYNKPPGPVLICYAFIAGMGANNQSATAVGLTIGILAALAVPATYLFVVYFTQDRAAAFWGASYLALCPSLVLYFPMFDQIYLLLTVPMAIIWAHSLRKNSMSAAFLLGLLTGFAGVINYGLGALAAFFLVYAIGQNRIQPRTRWVAIFRLAAVALAGLILFYLILWLATGFNPITSFIAAWKDEHSQLPYWTTILHLPARTLPGSIPRDLYDFDMGAGWMGYLLIVYLFIAPHRKPLDRATIWTVCACIFQFVFVALTGLLQADAQRLWIFMLPMLMLPIGLALAKMPPLARLAIFGALLALTTIIGQSICWII